MEGEMDLYHWAEEVCADHWDCQTLLRTLCQWRMKSENGILMTECVVETNDVFLARVSTILFPSILKWLGTHKNCIFLQPSSSSLRIERMMMANEV